MEYRLVQGDLLDQRVDVIVNAWNRNFIPWWLLLPQGVSGAIRRRGGVAPFREVARAGVLGIGQAILTTAGRLPYKGIIHVAGLNAFWRSTEACVRACTRNAIALADSHNFESMAFPLIGAGTGGLRSDRVKQWMGEEVSAAIGKVEVVIVEFVRPRR